MSDTNSDIDDHRHNENDQLVVKVLDQSNVILQFKINMNTALRKVMRAYLERAGGTIEQSKFLFNGVQVNENDTPMAHNMESGDTIEVFRRQEGGGYTSS